MMKSALWVASGVLFIANAAAQIVPRIGNNEVLSDLPPTFPSDAVTIPLGARVEVAELDVPSSSFQSYAVVWNEQRAGVTEIYLTIVSEFGTVQVEKYLVVAENQVGGTTLGPPAIAADGQGNFAVVWVEVEPENVGLFPEDLKSSIRYQLFAPIANGGQPTPLMNAPAELIDPDALFAPNTGDIYAMGDWPSVSVAASFDGRFAVAFSDVRNNTDPSPPSGRPQDATGDFSIYLALFDLSFTTAQDAALVGYPVGALPILLSNFGEYRAQPRVAVDANDDTAVVAWRESSGQLSAQAVTSLGALLGPRFNVVDQPDDVQVIYDDVDVAIDNQGMVWFAWTLHHYLTDAVLNKFSRIQMVQSDPSGQAFGAVIDVSTTAAGEPWDLRPMADPRLKVRDVNRNIGVTWQQSEGRCPGIGNVNPTGSPCGFEISAQQTLCQVDLLFHDACPMRIRVLPNEGLPSDGWYWIANDAPRDARGGLIAELRVLENPDARRNRCFDLEVTSGGGQPERHRIEQACTRGGDQCWTCDVQGVVKEGDTLDTAVTLQSVTKGSTSRVYDVFGRWFHSTSFSPEGTFIDQFQLSEYEGDQRAPTIAQARDGEMMVVWAGDDGGGDVNVIEAQRLSTAVEISVNDVGILEGPFRTTASFTVSASKNYPDPDPLSNDHPWPMPTVGVQTADDTATFLPPRPDYVPVQTAVVFLPNGSTEQAVTVEVTDDTVYEDSESFSLNLLNVTDAVLVKSLGVGVIVDNDSPQVVSVNAASICENGDNPDSGCTGVFTPPPDRPSVTLEVVLPSVQEVAGSVEFITRDGVATSTTAAALAGVDYESVSGEVQFLPGTRTGFITVELMDNLQQELDKVFVVELLNPSDLVLGGAQAEVTIINDDTCNELPIVEVPGGQPIVELVAAGETGYLCVTNTHPDDCSWNSQLEFDPGAPNAWLQRVDYPETAPPVEAMCGASATGFIAVTAEPNLPGTVRGVGGGGVSRTATLDVIGASEPNVFTVIQEGGACDPVLSQDHFEYYPVGGSGEVMVTLQSPPDDPSLCALVPWTVTLSAGTEDWIDDIRIDGVATLAGIGDKLVTFEVNENVAGASRNGLLLVNGVQAEIDQEGVFLDLFDDGSLPLGWSFSSSAWTEVEGRLLANVIEPVSAIARPAFPGCEVCTVQSTMRVDLFTKGTGTLYAWYLDVENHVRLEVDEFADQWRLLQRVAGSDFELKVLDADVRTGEDYAVELAYDGNDSNVVEMVIDGVVVCPPTSSGLPVCEFVQAVDAGTVGLGVAAAQISFDSIRVVRSDGDAYPAASTLDVVFYGDFE